MNYDLDAWTKLRLQELVKERMTGKYQHDAEGFIASFKEVTENAGYDYSKKVPSDISLGLGANQEHPSRTVIDEMWEDRDKLRHEVHHQLAMRARKHQFMTKRKETDFV
jgi:hypothetical protein